MAATPSSSGSRSSVRATQTAPATPLSRVSGPARDHPTAAAPSGPHGRPAMHHPANRAREHPAPHPGSSSCYSPGCIQEPGTNARIGAPHAPSPAPGAPCNAIWSSRRRPRRRRTGVVEVRTARSCTGSHPARRTAPNVCCSVDQPAPRRHGCGADDLQHVPGGHRPGTRPHRAVAAQVPPTGTPVPPIRHPRLRSRHPGPGPAGSGSAAGAQWRDRRRGGDVVAEGDLQALSRWTRRRPPRRRGELQPNSTSTRSGGPRRRARLLDHLRGRLRHLDDRLLCPAERPSTSRPPAWAPEVGSVPATTTASASISVSPTRTVVTGCQPPHPPPPGPRGHPGTRAGIDSLEHDHSPIRSRSVTPPDESLVQI